MALLGISLPLSKRHTTQNEAFTLSIVTNNCSTLLSKILNDCTGYVLRIILIAVGQRLSVKEGI